MVSSHSGYIMKFEPMGFSHGLEEKRQGLFLGFGLEYPTITSKTTYPQLTTPHSLQIPLFLWYVRECHHHLPSVPWKKPISLS